jgi:hypothetical protein
MRHFGREMNPQHGNCDSKKTLDFVRIAFWTTGIAVGAWLTYVTRYYLNSDGLNYLDIGDAVRRGHWDALVNHTSSPAYSVMVAMAQVLLNTSPADELPWLKSINFLLFLSAMASCDLFLHQLKEDHIFSEWNLNKEIPYSLIRIVVYCAFFVASLIWIRPRLIAPDMLVFALILVSVSMIFWIKRHPETTGGFLLLGLTLGLSYLVKTYMFLVSFLLILLAMLFVPRWKTALARGSLTIGIVVLISLPFMTALSRDIGRLTYGGAGDYNYAVFVAGQGSPKNPPECLTERPETFLSKGTLYSSFASGSDLAKSHEGLRPRFDLRSQITVLGSNLVATVVDSPWFFLSVLTWNILQLKWAKPRVGSIIPPSKVCILLTIAKCGILLFCLVVLEMRYIAPFLFLAVPGLAYVWFYGDLEGKDRMLRDGSTYLLAVILVVLVGTSAIDQYQRAVQGEGPKQSYKAVLEENQSIARFINSSGYGNEQDVALIEKAAGSIYWARMANVRIVAEVSRTKDYLDASSQERALLKNKLKDRSIKLLIGKGNEFDSLSSEGWVRIPHTQKHYILFTSEG